MTPDDRRQDEPLHTAHSEQHLLNLSFDETYKILMVGLGAYNPNTDTYDRVQIGSDGSLSTGGGGSTGTATVTSVAHSLTTVTILASNTARGAATIYNDSTADLYLKLGSVASTTSFTIKIGASGYYELPSPMYTGVITAVASAATGSARITELT